MGYQIRKRATPLSAQSWGRVKANFSLHKKGYNIFFYDFSWCKELNVPSVMFIVFVKECLSLACCAECVFSR